MNEEEEKQIEKQFKEDSSISVSSDEEDNNKEKPKSVQPVEKPTDLDDDELTD